MKLEYLKGLDNKIADTLSRLSPEKLDEHAVAELLDYARNSHKPRAETANRNVIEEGEHVDQEVIIPDNPQLYKRRNLAKLQEAATKYLFVTCLLDWYVLFCIYVVKY